MEKNKKVKKSENEEINSTISILNFDEIEIEEDEDGDITLYDGDILENSFKKK